MKKVFFLLFLAVCGNIYGDTTQPSLSNRTARTCDGYAGVFLTGEFIYWKARQEELNTIGTFSLEQNGVDRFVDIKVKEIDFKYSPGFKLGLGGNLPFDGWDLYVNWTHLHNNPVTTYRSSTHNLINTERLEGGGAPFVTNHAKVSYDLMLNIIDFDWGRRYFVSDTWSVRPSFGGKTFWIHQKIRYDYENVQTIPFPNIGVITGFPEFLNATNDYWGIGPYFAFEGKWNFGWGIGLLGKVSGALVWGKFEQKARSDQNDLEGGDGGPPTVTISHVLQEGNAHRVRPAAQMFVGLDWEWCFIPNRLSTQFRIGYETQFYWGQLLNLRGLEESDLSIEGLTVVGRIDF
jgi:hypothetical protein